MYIYTYIYIYILYIYILNTLRESPPPSYVLELRLLFRDCISDIHLKYDILYVFFSFRLQYVPGFDTIEFQTFWRLLKDLRLLLNVLRASWLKN